MQQRLLGGNATSLPDNSFAVQGLTVWRTDAADKSLATWVQVAEFELTGSPADS